MASAEGKTFQPATAVDLPSVCPEKNPGFILKATRAIPAKLEYDDATYWELGEASPAGETKTGMQYDNASFEVSTTDAHIPA